MVFFCFWQHTTTRQSHCLHHLAWLWVIDFPYHSGRYKCYQQYKCPEKLQRLWSKIFLHMQYNPPKINHHILIISIAAHSQCIKSFMQKINAETCIYRRIHIWIKWKCIHFLETMRLLEESPWVLKHIGKLVRLLWFLCVSGGATCDQRLCI